MECGPDHTRHAHPHPSAVPATASYAFIHHSAATLPNNLPPDVDDKLLARQKRRRTSPEDQAILESSYRLNPKPDKAARQQLVDQVALGEKEIQIWFQNRRQTSRRKSRPLLPHEVIQYQLTRSTAAQTLPPPQCGSKLELHDGADRTTEEGAGAWPSSDSGESESSERKNIFGYDVDAVDQSAISSQDTSLLENVPVEAHTCAEEVSPLQIPTTVSEITVTTSSKDHTGTVGYPTSRQNNASFQAAHMAAYLPQEPSRLAHAEPRWLRKSASYVHLSMTSEGNAKIVNKNISSPSPPRASKVWQSPKPSGLKVGGSGTAYRFLSNKPLQRSSSGRSRDSRAWEFWCDKDTRTELEDKAEKEASGSAANAIGLLRSASGRNILGSISSKRNSAVVGQQLPSKRSKLNNPSRSTLQKWSTSSGRLERKQVVDPGQLPEQLRKRSGSLISLHIPGNESDKENWSPDSSRLSVGSESTSTAPYGLQSSSKPLLTHEKDNPELDPELAAFMRGGRQSSKISEVNEDLDCVQGLLSLSQGNWR